jgi:hypothetical protein
VKLGQRDRSWLASMKQWQREEEAERNWVLEDLRQVWWNMVWVAGRFLEDVDGRRRGCYKEDRLAVLGGC